MSSQVATERCTVEGCDWSWAGDPDVALDRRREHEYEHELGRLRAAAGQPEPEKPKLAGGQVGGKSAAELEEEDHLRERVRVIVVSCYEADCGYREEGPHAEVRMRWAVHRRDDHGETDAVERMVRIVAHLGRRRRPGQPVVGSQKRKVLMENVEKTRKAGGGAGKARAEEPPAAPAPADGWTQERCLEELARWYREKGDLPRSSDLQRSRATRAAGFPTYDQVQRAFRYKPWREIIQQVADQLGVEMPGGQRGGRPALWSAESIVEAIREWSRARGGGVPKTSDFGANGLPSVTPVKRLFGSLGQAVAAAGLGASQTGPASPPSHSDTTGRTERPADAPTGDEARDAEGADGEAGTPRAGDVPGAAGELQPLSRPGAAAESGATGGAGDPYEELCLALMDFERAFSRLARARVAYAAAAREEVAA